MALLGEWGMVNIIFQGRGTRAWGGELGALEGLEWDHMGR